MPSDRLGFRGIPIHVNPYLPEGGWMLVNGAPGKNLATVSFPSKDKDGNTVIVKAETRWDAAVGLYVHNLEVLEMLEERNA